uniref:non-specific serine/threonine protein kinase n=1 Tax=Kalanchoe fedtschenkoi TaxID=63787 RepID=A0A7N1A881_KALFE
MRGLMFQPLLLSRRVCYPTPLRLLRQCSNVSVVCISRSYSSEPTITYSSLWSHRAIHRWCSAAQSNLSFLLLTLYGHRGKAPTPNQIHYGGPNDLDKLIRPGVGSERSSLQGKRGSSVLSDLQYVPITSEVVGACKTLAWTRIEMEVDQLISGFCNQLWFWIYTLPESNSEPDRTALLSLRNGLISGGIPSDGSALSSWNHSIHFCEWQGVTCVKKHNRVTEIWLSEQKLDGVLPPSIRNLTFLQVLNLSSNSLQVPKEIGHLRRLRYIDLERNSFEGRIPIELSNSSNLQLMRISINNFSGLLPFQFGSLSKLTVLFVNENNLVGEMPSFLRNISSLVELDLGTNHFHGEIHNSLQARSGGPQPRYSGPREKPQPKGPLQYFGTPPAYSTRGRLASRTATLRGMGRMLSNRNHYSCFVAARHRNHHIGSRIIRGLEITRLLRDVSKSIERVVDTTNPIRQARTHRALPGSVSAWRLSSTQGHRRLFGRNSSIIPRAPLAESLSPYQIDITLGPRRARPPERDHGIFAIPQYSIRRTPGHGGNGFTTFGQVNVDQHPGVCWAGHVQGSGIGHEEGSDLISINHFTGTLAQDMDVAFPKATFLSFYGNNFTGAIPSSLSNISGLTLFQILEKGLTGRVPNDLGKLRFLYFLQLSYNHLGNSEKSNDLNFLDSLTNCKELNFLAISYNRFGGQLPGSIANFSSSLQDLSMSNNYITGPIPEGIRELSGLSFISFNDNLLSGVIPNSIGKLGNLSGLYLSGNKLRGGIPSSIGNLTKLTLLNMEQNSLNGNIRSTLGNCTGMKLINISGNHFNGNLPKDLFNQFQNLWACDISRNSFDGIFPLGVGKLGVLNLLHISYSNFSRQIPNGLGKAVQLEYLDMAGNSFEGSIPTSLGRLRSLVYLDLSSNNLSGPIPKDLVNITSLQYLNLSFNKLEQLHLQICKNNWRKKGGILSRKGVIAICLSAFTSFSLFVIVCIFCRSRRIHKKGDVDSLAERFKRVTYTELLKATDDFAESNLIGTGSFGDVYKAVILHQNERKPVSMKVIKLSKHTATESFTTECKILRRIRHRNLLSVITSCSSLDNKGNDFKALVFEFMSNGTLDNWLHSVDRRPENRVLTLAKRLEIAINVGCALDYLHNGCETSIAHSDLKPSNILLDEDMVAHVGDFGLAKLLLGDFSGGESMSTALRGSISYIAPEYGMGAAVSSQGDIYRYRILLLELITGRRPTDDIIKDEMSLQNFFERALPDHVEEIVDQSLLSLLSSKGAVDEAKLCFTFMGTECGLHPKYPASPHHFVQEYRDMLIDEHILDLEENFVKLNLETHHHCPFGGS